MTITDGRIAIAIVLKPLKRSLAGVRQNCVETVFNQFFLAVIDI